MNFGWELRVLSSAMRMEMRMTMMGLMTVRSAMTISLKAFR